MYEKGLGWFWWSAVAIVALLLLKPCAFSCLTCGRWRCVFRHAEVSSRGKERETSSQKVTLARPYAFKWAWGRFKRSFAMMRWIPQVARRRAGPSQTCTASTPTACKISWGVSPWLSCEPHKARRTPVGAAWVHQAYLFSWRDQLLIIGLKHRRNCRES